MTTAPAAYVHRVIDEPEPDHLIVSTAGTWTASDVATAVNRVAHLVRAACFQPGGGSAPRRFGVFSENAGEAVIAHVGGMKSGASVVPMSAHLNASDAAYVLRTADVALVVAGPRTAAAAVEAAAALTDAGTSCQVVVWGTSPWDDWLASAPDGTPDDDRPIVPNLLFTSGTTGRPKATELPPNVFPTRSSWAEFVAASASNRFVGLGRHLVVAPLHHTGPLNAVRALAAGTPIGILDRFDATTTLQAIEQWRIGSTTLVPTHMSRLLALPDEVRRDADLSSLRLVFQTGSSCPVHVKRAMIDWWGPVFLEAYGATEVGVTASITSEDWLAHPGSVGRSAPPYEVVVVDEAGAELPPDQEGRLCFRDTTGRGIVYHDDPERSAAAHVAPGVFTLGEIGRVDADGWIYVTDRFADMVVTGGVNVYPAEAEQAIVDHPGVADVAGIGLPHPDLGEQLVALVVPTDPASPPTAEEILAWCGERISRYKLPREIRFVETLARNALGKLDKRSLRSRYTT